MKVTVKFDEAAGMTPEQVRVKQRCEQQWAEAERVKRDAIAERYYAARAEWRVVEIAAAFEAAKPLKGGVR